MPDPTYKLDDVLEELPPCRDIDSTVPFIFPRRNILNHKLIADFDSKFAGEPPLAEKKPDYKREANLRGVQICQGKKQFLEGEPIAARIKALTCRQKTTVHCRFSVNEFSLGSLFHELAHTWEVCNFTFVWDKAEEPVVNLFDKGYSQPLPSGSDGFGTMLRAELSIILDDNFISLNTSWMAPKSGWISSAQSITLCNSFSDDAYEDDLGPDPSKGSRIVNTDWGNPFYTYFSSGHSVVTFLTSPRSDGVFAPIIGSPDIGDNFNALPWKDFYWAKTYNRVSHPIVTWILVTEIWATGPPDDDPEA